MTFENCKHKKQYKGPQTAIPVVSYDSSSLIFLAYIDNFYVYDVSYGLIQGESSVNMCVSVYKPNAYEVVSKSQKFYLW